MASRFFPKSLKLSSDSAPGEKKQAIPIQREGGSSCTCSALPVAFLRIPPPKELHSIGRGTKRERQRTGRATAASLPPRLPRTRSAPPGRAGELTVVAVEFGAVEPAAPRLSQHYLRTRQRSPLRNSRHCCGAFSPLDLLLLQLLPGRSALLPPDVILGPFRHSFRYNVTTQQSALLAFGIGGGSRSPTVTRRRSAGLLDSQRQRPPPPSTPLRPPTF